MEKRGRKAKVVAKVSYAPRNQRKEQFSRETKESIMEEVAFELG